MGNSFTATHFLGFIIGGIIILIVAAPIALLIGTLIALKKAMDWMKAEKEATKEAIEAAKATEEESEVANVVESESSAAAVPAEPGKTFRKHINLGEAAVDVWFHPDSGVARRTVRINDKALAEQHGEKFKLPEIQYIEAGDVETIMQQTIGEVKTKLGLTATAAKVVKASKIAKTAKVAKTVAVGTEVPRAHAKAQSSYTGEILRLGMEEKDGREGPYQTYTLHIFDQQAGAPHQLCGTDLERAVKEAGVAPGDRVTVESLGRTQVTLGNGKAGHKNLWSVSKV